MEFLIKIKPLKTVFHYLGLFSLASYLVLFIGPACFRFEKSLYSELIFSLAVFSLPEPQIFSDKASGMLDWTIPTLGGQMKMLLAAAPTITNI